MFLLLNRHQQNTITVVYSKKIPVDKILHGNEDSNEIYANIYSAYLTVCHYFNWFTSKSIIWIPVYYTCFGEQRSTIPVPVFLFFLYWKIITINTNLQHLISYNIYLMSWKYLSNFGFFGNFFILTKIGSVVYFYRDFLSNKFTGFFCSWWHCDLHIIISGSSYLFTTYVAFCLATALEMSAGY